MVNESKDGIGKIRPHQKNFLREKKIVYSMERLAVRAENVSGDGSKSKIFEKQILCIESEKMVFNAH